MRSAAAADPGRDLILGRYRAIRPLGSGGSGTVWLARDVREGREVALKVVPREGKAGERAEREAHAVARLRSRHVARAYAVARDDRHVYVAYEYVPGKTLREAIRAGELSDPGAVEAAAQVLDALAHAHRKGIVHRDVKPANVLLEAGDDVSARLLDFGLAQLEEADTLTAAGDVPGTLAYISPERLAGKQCSGAADVWAVGVILWEALAGYQPFWSASPVDTAKLIAQGAPPLRTVRPDLPERLTAVVDRALALDARRRPGPERLAADLRASLAEAAKRRQRRSPASRRVVLERVGHAALAAGFAALAATLFPFFPTSLVAALAALTALASFVDPRAGLALALAVPALGLGDVSLGLALCYLPAAAVLLAISWRDARHGLLFVFGPLLALVGALALVPLVAERASGPLRRFLQGALAVLLAALVAGMRGTALPLSGTEAPPLGLGLMGSDDAIAVAGALGRALAAHPTVPALAVVVGLAAATLPAARGRGLWGAAAYAAALMAGGLVAPSLVGGDVSVLPVVLCAWATAAILAAPVLRDELGPALARRAAGPARSARTPAEPDSSELTTLVDARAGSGATVR